MINDDTVIGTKVSFVLSPKSCWEFLDVEGLNYTCKFSTSLDLIRLDYLLIELALKH